MRNNKFFLAFISIVIVCAHAVIAQQIKEPGENQVVLVGKLALSPPLDKDFLAATIYNVNPSKPTKTSIFASFNSFSIREFDDFFIVLFNTKDERFSTLSDEDKPTLVELKKAVVYPFSCEEAHFTLPLQMKFYVPKNVKYLYIGSIYFTVEGFRYTVVSVDVRDEYEAAKKALEDRLNRECELSRAALMPSDK